MVELNASGSMKTGETSTLEVSVRVQAYTATEATDALKSVVSDFQKNSEEGERCGGRGLLTRNAEPWPEAEDCPGCPDCETREAVPEEAVEASRRAMVKWNVDRDHGLREVLTAALPALEAAWRKRLEEVAGSFEREADEIEAEMNAETTEGHIDGFLKRWQFETLRDCATRLRAALKEVAG